MTNIHLRVDAKKWRGGDAEGDRLSSVTLPGTGWTVNFQYDPFGRRIYQSSSAGTYIYVYDGENIIQELNGSGSLVAQYTQGLGVDEPLAMYGGATAAYFLTDGLGSVVSLTNPAGAVAASYVYDSFGNLTASTGTVTIPFQYVAREFDSETSLYYYRARYYDPSPGRFSSEGPIRWRSGDVNFYRYVFNDPILFHDPFGFSCFCTYSISTGHFQCAGFGNLSYINTYGYSGYGYAQNNLAETDLPGINNPRQGGPIPLGTWTFGNGFSDRRGDPSFDLTATQNVLIPPGRSGNTGSFMIHADKISAPGTASEGCIVLPEPGDRRKLAACHGGTLEVTP